MRLSGKLVRPFPGQLHMESAFRTLNIAEMPKEFNDETGQGVGLLCRVTFLVL